ncbi:MAG: heme-binding protein, partial [Gammaproteobacteria bacterium]
MKQLHSGLSLAQGRQIVVTALAVGREAKLAPLTVAVLDIGGHLVCL